MERVDGRALDRSRLDSRSTDSRLVDSRRIEGRQENGWQVDGRWADAMRQSLRCWLECQKVTATGSTDKGQSQRQLADRSVVWTDNRKAQQREPNTLQPWGPRTEISCSARERERMAGAATACASRSVVWTDNR